MTSRPPCSTAPRPHPSRRQASVLAVLALLVAAGCSSSSGSTPARTITGLDLAPAAVSVAVHGTQQLTATATWSDGATENVSASAGWVSSATTTASVTNGGLVTGQGVGLAQIVATYGGKSAARDVTVTAPEVTLTSIAIAPATAAVEIGRTLQLTVTGTYSDSSTGDLTAEASFVSGVTSVATVTSPGGLVTGVAAGTTTLTATARGKTAARAVTVSAPEVAPAPAQIVFWDGYGADVTFRDFDGAANNVNVDSAETYHGRKSIKFVVTGSGGYSGGAWIAATPRDLTAYDALTFYAKASADNTVNVTGFGNDGGAGLGIGLPTERAAVPVSTAWQKFTIPIPDPAALTSVAGLFHLADAPDGYTLYLADVVYEHLGLAPGAGAINLAHAMPSVVMTATTAVNPAQSQVVYTIAGDPAGTVTLNPVANRFFAFTSSDPAVATVSADGVITGVTPGAARVTATLRGAGIDGEYAVTVTGGAAYPATLPPIPPEPVTSVYALYSSVTGGYAGTSADRSATVGTWHATWSAGTGGDPYQVTSTAGTAAPRRYAFTSGGDFVGVEFVGTAATGVHDIDVAALGLNTLHVDVWTPDAAEVQLGLVDFGDDAAFGGSGGNADATVTKSLTAASTPALATGSWISYDLPLATAFPGIEGKHHVAQLVLKVPGGGTLFIDNLYFYVSNAAPVVPTPATLPPVPAHPAANVYALYSSVTGGYGGTAADQSATVDTWLASWSWGTGGTPFPITVGGASAAPRKYVLTKAAPFIGIEFLSHKIDAAALGLTTLHVDLWTPDNALNFQVKLVNNGATVSEGIATLTAGSTPPLATGKWLSYELAIPAGFPDGAGLTATSSLGQLVLVAPEGGTMYVDNLYLHK